MLTARNTPEIKVKLMIYPHLPYGGKTHSETILYQTCLDALFSKYTTTEIYEHTDMPGLGIRHQGWGIPPFFSYISFISFSKKILSKHNPTFGDRLHVPALLKFHMN